MGPSDVAGGDVKWWSVFGKLAVSQNMRHNPGISLIGVYPRELKINVGVKTCIPMFIIHNSQKMETTQIFIS